MFGTDLLSSIGSLNTVYTAIDICHVDCLLAVSQHYKQDKYLLLCIHCWDSWWWTV